MSPGLSRYQTEIAAVRRVLRDRTTEPGRFAEYFASSAIRRDIASGLSAADLRKSFGVLRAAGVEWDLRTRAAASMVRHRRLWDAVRAAIARQCERNVRRRFPGVHAAQLAARADGGFDSQFQFARLWELAELVEIAEPQSCLEFGTGASTAMFSESMRGRGPLVSVEESPYWYGRLQEYIRQFAGDAESIQADRVLTEFDGDPVVHYALPHDRHYDFVYVDGPSNEPPEEMTPAQRERAYRLDDRGRLPNADIELMWRAGVYPRMIVLDGRLGTLRRWLKFGIPRYDLILKSEYYAYATGQVPDYFLHHTILRLRD